MAVLRLNCDPADDSDFVWTLSKQADQSVTLSPRDPYAGRTLYSSVRDDWDWCVQVQAPNSADWITAVGRNEIMNVQWGALLTLSLQAWNSQYVTVDAELSVHDAHSGYRLRAADDQRQDARTFFLGITKVHQPELALPLARNLTPEDIGSALGSATDSALVEYLQHQVLSSPS